MTKLRHRRCGAGPSAPLSASLFAWWWCCFAASPTTRGGAPTLVARREPLEGLSLLMKLRTGRRKVQAHAGGPRGTVRRAQAAGACESGCRADMAALQVFREAQLPDVRAQCLSTWDAGVGTAHCGWHGVVCNNRGRVTGLGGDFNTWDTPSQAYRTHGLLSGCGLTAVDGIGNLSELLFLDLSNNRLAAVPKVESMRSLGHVDLSGNRLEALPGDWLRNNTQLIELSLADNLLTTLPGDWLRNNTQLIELSLADNLLTTLPDGLLHRATGLYTVDLSSNHLEALPDDLFGAGSSVQQVVLSRNRLRALSRSHFYLPSLVALDVAHNMQLSSLPDDVFASLLGLRYLDVSSTALTQLPSSIGMLTRLGSVQGNNAAIESLSESLCGCCQASPEIALAFDGNKLTQLPPCLGNLSAMTLLRVNNNQLTALPSSLEALSNLQDLELHGNRIRSLPTNLSAMTALQTIRAAENALVTLPTLWSPHLQELYLGYNDLPAAALADSSFRLPQLQSLRIEHNHIQVLPEDLQERLPQLHMLYVGHNGLVRLPSRLGDAQFLEVLSVSDNYLTSLPDSLEHCGTLWYVDGRNNSFERLPLANGVARISHLYLEQNPLNVSAAVVSSTLYRDAGSLRAFQLGASTVETFVSPFVVDGPRLCKNGTRTLDKCSPQVDRDYSLLDSDCHVGSPCTFTLFFKDVDTIHARAGGLRNLSAVLVGRGGGTQPLQSVLRTTCVDNRDGSYACTIPAMWVNQTGLYSFQLFHGEQEFWAGVSTQDRFLCGSTDCTGPTDTTCWTVTNFPQPCLLRLRYAPMVCTGDYAQAELLHGNRCVCNNGFVPRSGNQLASSTLSCRPLCGDGTTESRDGASCQCTGDTYNVSATGVILCRSKDYTSPERTAEWQAVMRELSHTPPDRCRACPLECATCDNGVATIRPGWRPVRTGSHSFATGGTAQHGSSTTAATFALFIYKCPSSSYGTQACPSLLLNNRSVSLPGCLANHTHYLCALCTRGFSRKHSDNSCTPCATSLWVSHFGVSLPWFVASLIATALVCVVLLLVLKQRLLKLKEIMSTNTKIVLGMLQVITLLKDVLNIIYPPAPQHAMSYAQLVTVDVQAVIQFDCWGFDWYTKWSIVVLVIPGGCLCSLMGRFLWQRWKAGDAKQAYQSFVEKLFLVVLVLYPRVSATVLSALRCRDLGTDLQGSPIQVLEVDYGVSCTSSSYIGYRVLAYLFTVVYIIGIPLCLALVLWRKYIGYCQIWRKEQRAYGEGRATDSLPSLTSTANATCRRPVSSGGRYAGKDRSLLLANKRDTDSLPVADIETSMPLSFMFEDQTFKKEYGFCVSDYRPDCFWFEPVDMLRKLAFSGLLQFFQRGTAAQVLLGCTLSVLCFGGQIWLCPYHTPAANILKVLVELQIFVTFLISFILRVLPRVQEYEPFDAQIYGYLLLTSIFIFLLIAVGLTTAPLKRYQRRQGGRVGRRLVQNVDTLFMEGSSELLLDTTKQHSSTRTSVHTSLLDFDAVDAVPQPSHAELTAALSQLTVQREACPVDMDPSVQTANR